MKKIALLVTFFALFFSACQNEANKAQTATQAAAPTLDDATPPPSPKPEIYLYVVLVDNLLLRDQPTQKGSKVVAKFKLGEFVQGSGEISPNQEEATIRGIPITAPFLKITSTTPEEHSGWAFGGALRPVYAGPRATSPDLGRLTQFSTFLKNLNAKQIDSGQKAWNYVKTNFSDTKGTLADAAFILLENFLHQMAIENEFFYQTTEKIAWTESEQHAVSEQNFDTNKYPQTKNLAESGFRLLTAEGSIFAGEDWRQFEAFFADRVTPPMKQYIRQSRLEQDETAFEDGGIVIPLEELVDRAAFWEKFNLNSPYFVLHEETQISQQWTLEALFNGADNTPVFGYENGALNEDFKKAWSYAQSQYSGTRVGKSAKAMAELVAAEGNKRTKKVEDFQATFQSAGVAE